MFRNAILSTTLILAATSALALEKKHLKVFLWGMKCDATAGHDKDDVFVKVSGTTDLDSRLKSRWRINQVGLGKWPAGQEKHLEQLLFEGDVFAGSFELHREVSFWQFFGGDYIGAVEFDSSGRLTPGGETDQPEPGPRPTGEILFRLHGEGANYLVALKVIWNSVQTGKPSSFQTPKANSAAHTTEEILSYRRRDRFIGHDLLSRKFEQAFCVSRSASG